MLRKVLKKGAGNVITFEVISKALKVRSVTFLRIIALENDKATLFGLAPQK